MSLKNLLGISLDAVAADKGSVGMLIAAAERNIADAQLGEWLPVEGSLATQSFKRFACRAGA